MNLLLVLVHVFVSSVFNSGPSSLLTCRRISVLFIMVLTFSCKELTSSNMEIPDLGYSVPVIPDSQGPS